MPNVRRSLTITEENDRRVQSRRAMFLGFDNPIDIDYTTMVNMLIELGDLIFKKKWDSNITLDIGEVIPVAAKYMSNVDLKDEALFDQFQDWWVKNFSKIPKQSKK